MKKLSITFFFLLLLTASIQAQEYLPLISQGKSWYCMFPDDDNTILCYMVSGDTVINNAKYDKILFRYCAPRISEWEYFAAVREDIESQKVYMMYNFSNNEKLVYDFDLANDSYLYLREDYRLGYYESKTFVIKNIKRRFIYYTSEYLEEDGSWNFPTGLYHFIEGIGYGSNPIDIESWFDGNVTAELIACFENGACVADVNNYDTLYDNTERINTVLNFVLSGINDVSDAEKSISPTRIHSLDGRRLQRLPEKGVYIVNGRKVVRK